MKAKKFEKSASTDKKENKKKIKILNKNSSVKLLYTKKKINSKINNNNNINNTIDNNKNNNIKNYHSLLNNKNNNNNNNNHKLKVNLKTNFKTLEHNNNNLNNIFNNNNNNNSINNNNNNNSINNNISNNINNDLNNKNNLIKDDFYEKNIINNNNLLICNSNISNIKDEDDNFNESFYMPDLHISNIKISNPNLLLLTNSKISIQAIALINDLLKHQNIANQLFKIIKPFQFKKENKKIIFNFNREKLYEIDFLFHFNSHKLKKICKKTRNIKKRRISAVNSSKLSLNSKNLNEIEKEKNKINNNKTNNNLNDFPLSLNETINNTINETLTKGISAGTNKNHIIQTSAGIDPLLLNSALNESKISTTTLKIERRKSLFPSTKENSNFMLTKIPQKTQENTENIRLNIAYKKAKDAARVVRRLEYSYSMRISILLSKPMFQKKAKIIQNWWRSLMFIKKNKIKLVKIQKIFRGFLIRKAFNDTFKLCFKIVPFLKIIDKIFSRFVCEFVFNKFLNDFGYLVFFNILSKFANKIIKKMRIFYKNQQLFRKIKTVSKKFLNKCVFIKTNIEKETIKKIIKLQSLIRKFLLQKNEKFLLKFGKNYHPFLYYKLKYNNNKKLFEKKIKNLKKFLLKLKELKIKANKKINNKFEYLNYLLKKIFIWNKFKEFYNNNLKETKNNPLKLKQFLMKKILNKKNIFNKKFILKNYFYKWKNFIIFFNSYFKKLICFKLQTIDVLIRMKIKFYKKIFIFILKIIFNIKNENLKQKLKNLLKIHSKRNSKKFNNKILFKYFNIWRYKNFKIKINNFSSILNKNFKKFLMKLKLNKLKHLKKLLINKQNHLKNYLLKWKLINKIYKINSNFFFKKTKKKVLINKKKISLLKNIKNLNKRKLNFLRKNFTLFKINLNMNYRLCLFNNIQISFFHKNKKFIANKKYRMLKYLINKIENNEKIGRWDLILIKFFNYWKSFGKYQILRNSIYKFVKNKCKREFYIKKQKILFWYRKVKNEKIINFVWMIQRKFHTYKRNKNKKENILKNNNNNKINSNIIINNKINSNNNNNNKINNNNNNNISNKENNNNIKNTQQINKKNNNNNIKINSKKKSKI